MLLQKLAVFLNYLITNTIVIIFIVSKIFINLFLFLMIFIELLLLILNIVFIRGYILVTYVSVLKY